MTSPSRPDWLPDPPLLTREQLGKLLPEGPWDRDPTPWRHPEPPELNDRDSG